MVVSSHRKACRVLPSPAGPQPLEPRTLFAAPPPSPALATTPSIEVVIDYSLDTNNFFDTQQKRDLLQQAADSVVTWLRDELLAIDPSGSDTWDAVLDHPGTGGQHTLRNREIGRNEVLLFAGGRDMTDALGRGGPGGYEVRGTTAWRDRVARRGQNGGGPEFGPWGGAITFDTNPASPWHFGTTTAGLNGANDFLSVAAHEVAHLLGFGTSDAWTGLTSGATFAGPKSVVLYDAAGNVPLDDDDSHWANGTRDEGEEVALDPLITTGTRRLLSPLDFAGLDDIGWEMPPQVTAVSASRVTAAGTAHPFSITYSHYADIDAVTLGAADVTVVAPDDSVLPATFVKFTSADGGATLTANYTVAGPGGAWGPGDGGTYAIVLGANEVRSTTGEPVAPGALATFEADVADAPSASLQPPPPPPAGSASLTLVVAYTDAVAVDPTSIDPDDITVTTPDGAPLDVLSATVDSTTPEPARVATYTLAAPGGAWGPEDDGVYTVTLRPSEIRDTSGNATPGTTLGSFETSLGAVRFDARTPAVYTDARGGTVRVTLKGPGTGRVRLASAQPADAVSIDFNDTTALSTVSVRTGPGGATVGSIVVNGSLRSLVAKTASLTTGITATGSLGVVRLANVAGAVTAASLGTVQATAWDADVATGSIGRFKATTLSGDLLASGTIGPVVAGALAGSRIFAGVRDDFTGTNGLPDSPDDFANPAASIRSVVARSTPSARIAAPTVGKVSLGVLGTNAGGVAADRILSIFGKPSTLGVPPLRFRNLDAPGSGTSTEWFDVIVL